MTLSIDNPHGSGPENVAMWNVPPCQAPGTGNAEPIADFTYDCTDLSCDVDGYLSADHDGSIASYA